MSELTEEYDEIEDVYNSDLLENDEITPTEAGFMQGYNTSGEGEV